MIETYTTKSKQKALLWYINLKATNKDEEVRNVYHNTETNQSINQQLEKTMKGNVCR